MKTIPYEDGLFPDLHKCAAQLRRVPRGEGRKKATGGRTTGGLVVEDGLGAYECRRRWPESVPGLSEKLPASSICCRRASPSSAMTRNSSMVWRIWGRALSL